MEEKIATLSKFTTESLLGAGTLVMSEISDQTFGVKLIWEEQNAINRIKKILAMGISGVILASIAEKFTEVLEEYEDGTNNDINPDDK